MQRIAKFFKVDCQEYIKSFDADKAEQAQSIWEDIVLPKRATMYSAGYDFFAPFDIDLEVGESINIPTGIRVDIEEGWVMMIFPRSGLGFKPAGPGRSCRHHGGCFDSRVDNKGGL